MAIIYIIGHSVVGTGSRGFAIERFRCLSCFATFIKLCKYIWRIHGKLLEVSR